MDALIFLSVMVIPAMVMVWVIGFALALLRWRRHPRVSLFALLAFATMLVSYLLRVALPPIMRESGWLTDQIRPIFFAAIGVFSALTSAIAWAFVIRAIFGWRDGPQKQDIPPPSPSTFGNESSAQNATL
jgi:hypothetical protein